VSVHLEYEKILTIAAAVKKGAARSEDVYELAKLVSEYLPIVRATALQVIASYDESAYGSPDPELVIDLEECFPPPTTERRPDASAAKPETTETTANGDAGNGGSS
jgi:hypothetical protein